VKHRSVRVPINDGADVAVARIAGAELAIENGFDIVHRHCVMTSISELAANMLQHASSGTIELQLLAGPNGDVGMEITARDEGPGIENVALALQYRFTIGDQHGCGLAGVHRLMSEMEITSRVGAGTVIRAVKWRSDRYLRRPLLPIAGADETAQKAAS